jgi:hypothetical protein
MWFGLTTVEIRKSAWIGLFLALDGMALQLLKSRLFLHLQPPAVQFIVTVFILYVLTGFLFATVYFFVRDHIPGRTRARKGFNCSLLVFGSVAFGGLIGTIGLDMNGGFDLLTAAKVDDYAIAITDLLNLCLTGLVLGTIAEPKLVRPFNPALDAKRLWQLSAAGFVLFPTVAALLFNGLSCVIPIGIEVPLGAKVWFYLGTFVPMAISGASIPLFYGIVRGRFPGGAARKAAAFSLLFTLGLQAINLIFGLLFGLAIGTVVDLLIATAIPIFLLTWVSAYALESGGQTTTEGRVWTLQQTASRR